jgi:hypothetical protein
MIPPLVKGSDDVRPGPKVKTMHHTPRATRPTAAGLAAFLAVLLVLSPPNATVASGQDFLFSAPHGSLGIRGGWHASWANGDIFDDLTSHLTLGRGDFQAALGGADLAVSLSRRLDAVLGVAYSSTRTPSEDVEWEWDDGVPIEQSTRLEQLPITGGLKFYLTSRGTSIGQFAWVPSRMALFVGAAGGWTRYRLKLSGDFVARGRCSVDEHGEWCPVDDGVELNSNGWAPTVHAFGGADIRAGRRTFFTIEARHAWARTDLDDRYFEGYDPIDLSGLQLSLGWSVRF